MGRVEESLESLHLASKELAVQHCAPLSPGEMAGWDSYCAIRSHIICLSIFQVCAASLGPAF